MRRLFRSSSKQAKKPREEPSQAIKDDAFDHPYGLHLISASAEPAVDVVAVHGLNGHYEKTWTAGNGVNWLRNLLPADLDNVRIFSWGYNANTHSGSDVSGQHLYNHGQTLVSELWLKREMTQTSRRPIIFIAHSLGGLVVKSALIHSDNAREGALLQHRSISLSTYGIFFMGTPHQGGNGVALGTLLVNVASIFVAGNDRLLQHLKPNSEWLQMQLDQYASLSSSYVTKFAFEEYETPTALGRSLWVVPRHSAVVPGARDAEAIAIHANHVDMVKFSSRQDPGYRAISGHIRIMLVNAGESTRRRWEHEDGRNAVSHGTARPDTSYLIPFESNPNFVGRETDMAAIRRRLFDIGSKKLSLFGLGGIGKTQLAIQFAHWVKNTQTDRSVFWLSASNMPSFDAACVDLAAELNIPKLEENDDPRRMIKQYLSSERSGKWLLIVDNADDSKTLFGQRQEEGIGGILQFLPMSESGLILFTTRDAETAYGLSGNSIQKICDFNLSEATSLFHKLRSVGSGGTDIDDKAEVESLVKNLALHPLAITQAAAYTTTTEMTVSEYINLLGGADQDVVGLLSRESHDDSTKEFSAVATTWLVSFEKIRKKHPAAAELLCFISQIEPRAIPFSLLPESSTNEQKMSSIGTLVAYRFLTRQQDKTLYNAHRLVHLATRVWMQNDRISKSTAQRSIVHIARVFPSDDYQNRSIWRAYLPHATRIATCPDTGEMGERSALCLKVGKCLLVDGRSYESVEWLSRACDGRKTLEETHLDRLASQYALSIAYQAAGQVGKAVAMLEHVVAVEEKTLIETHPSRLASQHALAGAYQAAGQVGKAVTMLEHVVAIREKTLDETHPDRLASQHALSIAYQAVGQVDKAVTMLEHVVAVREKTLDETHPSRLASQHELAGAYQAAGQVGKAVTMLEHVVAVREKTLDETHPDRLASQYGLSIAYLVARQVGKAVTMLEHVVAVEEKTLDETHPDRLASQHALAVIYALAT